MPLAVAIEEFRPLDADSSGDFGSAGRSPVQEECPMSGCSLLVPPGLATEEELSPWLLPALPSNIVAGEEDEELDEEDDDDDDDEDDDDFDDDFDDLDDDDLDDEEFDDDDLDDDDLDDEEFDDDFDDDDEDDDDDDEEEDDEGD
jgi:hypothetical protein